MKTIGEWLEVRCAHVADCRVFSVERSSARLLEDGTEHDFYRIKSVDWAQIVPVTASGDVVMVRQYRHGVQRETLEIPGGLVDRGEAPGDAAVREMLEETGYRAASVRPLGVLSPNPALFSNRLHAFVGEGAERVGPIRNSGAERTSVEIVPQSEISRLLIEGVIDHALVVATLWRYLHDAGGAALR
ncbi:MAG TPA: NUDIX hydrolase [Gammaproteobacteria bacterium]